MGRPLGEIKHPPTAASWETRGYWEGADRGELVLQRCRDCQTVQHRPRAVCASCLSSEIEHFVASGRGTVYTFTVTRTGPGLDQTTTVAWTAEPSGADTRITTRLRDALALVDIRVLDHIIVGDGEPVSLAERGVL